MSSGCAAKAVGPSLVCDRLSPSLFSRIVSSGLYPCSLLGVAGAPFLQEKLRMGEFTQIGDKEV